MKLENWLPQAMDEPWEIITQLPGTPKTIGVKMGKMVVYCIEDAGITRLTNSRHLVGTFAKLTVQPSIEANKWIEDIRTELKNCTGEPATKGLQAIKDLAMIIRLKNDAKTIRISLATKKYRCDRDALWHPLFPENNRTDPIPDLKTIACNAKIILSSGIYPVKYVFDHAPTTAHDAIERTKNAFDVFQKHRTPIDPWYK